MKQSSLNVYPASVLALMAPILIGCEATAPSRFTTENISLLRQGMTVLEVEKLFGSPDSIRRTVCGGDRPWDCEIWTYGGRGSYLRNVLWFSVRDGRVLNQWDVTSAR